MITAINSTNNSLCRGIHNNVHSSNVNKINSFKNLNYTDSVSFSGAEKAVAKLSDNSTELVQKFAKKLILNKMYKFETPNVENIQLASVASRKNPDKRHLFIQYSSYSKDNSAKFILFSVNKNGEIYENGERVTNKKDLELFEDIVPKLITKASKELRISLK